MLMVTGRETDYQVQQAHGLQLRYPTCLLYYYAYNTDDYPMPIVQVAEEAFVLLNGGNYHPVAY